MLIYHISTVYTYFLYHFFPPHADTPLVTVHEQLHFEQTVPPGMTSTAHFPLHLQSPYVNSAESYAQYRPLKTVIPVTTTVTHINGFHRQYRPLQTVRTITVYTVFCFPFFLRSVPPSPPFFPSPRSSLVSKLNLR